MENTKEYILSLVTYGLSLIPITEGKKNPHLICLDENKHYDLLTRRATKEEIEKWINSGVKSWGVAGGNVSGNLVTLDFDEKHQPGMFDFWYKKLSDDQRKIVDTCYKNKTRNGGTHLRYRTQTSQPTIKVARTVEYNKMIDKEEIVTLTETRAENAYALIPPSAGYTTLSGSLLDLPLVLDEIHDELIDIMRIFNEVKDEPPTEYEWKLTDTPSGDRPGDRLNDRATWNQILEPHGWAEEAKNHWRRPGKNKGEGISATTDFGDRPMFYVFSTSASPFIENRGYSKFHTYTLLNHAGDFKASAKAINKIYPKDIYKKGIDEVSVEVLIEMLKHIPPNTPKVSLMGGLNPVFNKLVEIERITAEAFIMNNIREYFKITKEEAKKYIPYLNKLRVELLKKSKISKYEEEKLPLILDRDIDFQEAYRAILEVGIVTEETFKLITAIVISSQLRLNPPLWIFLIGVPSSLKTELVGLYGYMEEVYTLDTMTENAFASGYVMPDATEPQDLLPLLDNKCFIIKDLNTLFSMNEEMVKKVLGDLTSIFDGVFKKFTATRGMIEYHSLFSMIGCITPSILIKHYNYATQLGPRFFFLRLPELTEEELQNGFKKSWSENNRKEKIIKTRQIVSSYSTQLGKKIKNYVAKNEPDYIKTKINNISIFVCRARGIAITNKATFKNEKGEDITFYEIKDWQVEQPWRILNQLKSLLRILAFINGSNAVGEAEIAIIRPIILSTMPVDRAEILSFLTKEYGQSAKNLADKIGKSSKTIRRTLKELEALKIVDCYKDPEMNMGGNSPWLFFIIPEFASILDALVPPPESLSLSRSNMGDFVQEDEDD